uniref:Uncharacterized protein n=1 Tax=Arundo donax TaxID=35708 RepID=A0A0A9EDQ1_ARUDO
MFALSEFISLRTNPFSFKWQWTGCEYALCSIIDRQSPVQVLLVQFNKLVNYPSVPFP